MHDLLTIRLELDAAITYGHTSKARRLAAQGVKVARQQIDLAEVMYFRAQQKIINEEYREAIRFLDLAIRFNPQDGAAFNDRGLCMAEMGMLREALTYFDRGIAAEPNYATIYHNKGWLLNRLGRHTEAIMLFNKALDLEPDRAVTFENLADTYLQLGRLKEARDAYRQSLALLKSAPRTIREQINGFLQQLGD